jgi:hypothetical protein
MWIKKGAPLEVAKLKAWFFGENKFVCEARAALGAAWFDLGG